MFRSKEQKKLVCLRRGAVTQNRLYRTLRLLSEPAVNQPGSLSDQIALSVGSAGGGE